MTFVRYPNFTATSESRRFRIEIEGTPTEEFFRDQSRFVYRLYESDRLLWERAARNSEDPLGLLDYPHEAWVSDEGWVVVRSHTWMSGGLTVLSPEGKIILSRLHRRSLDEDQPGFLESEPDHFMEDTSAGPFWSRSSLAYFHTYRDRPFWTIRTWWGRRVHIDLAQAAILDPHQVDRRHAWHLETRLVHKVLADTIDELESRAAQQESDEYPSNDFSSFASPIHMAAYHAGWLRATEAVPFLRRLETLRAVGHRGYGYVSWADLNTFSFRQVAKLSLLRIGQEPRWMAHYRFHPGRHSQRPTHPVDFPERVEERRPELLQPGLTPQETLQRIGAPDFIDRDDWEYDFLSPELKCTARICWDESHLKEYQGEEYWSRLREAPPRLLRVDLIEPQWKQISMRDYYITH